MATLTCECGQEFEGSQFMLVPECQECRDNGITNIPPPPDVPLDWLNVDREIEYLRRIQQPYRPVTVSAGEIISHSVSYTWHQDGSVTTNYNNEQGQ